MHVSHSVVSDSLWLLPGSSVHGILQARILEWVAIPFSTGSSQPREWTWVSCIAGKFFTVCVYIIHRNKVWALELFFFLIAIGISFSNIGHPIKSLFTPWCISGVDLIIQFSVLKHVKSFLQLQFWTAATASSDRQSKPSVQDGWNATRLTKSLLSSYGLLHLCPQHGHHTVPNLAT